MFSFKTDVKEIPLFLSTYFYLYMYNNESYVNKRDTNEYSLEELFASCFDAFLLPSRENEIFVQFFSSKKLIKVVQNLKMIIPIPWVQCSSKQLDASKLWHNIDTISNINFYCCHQFKKIKVGFHLHWDAHNYSIMLIQKWKKRFLEMKSLNQTKTRC